MSLHCGFIAPCDSTVLPFITLVTFCFLLGVFHWMLSSVGAEPCSPFLHHWSASYYQLAWYISWAQKYLMINEGRTKEWREYVFPEIAFCIERATLKRKLLMMKWYQKAYWLTEKHNISRPHSKDNKISLKAGEYQGKLFAHMLRTVVSISFSSLAEAGVKTNWNFPKRFSQNSP